MDEQRRSGRDSLDILLNKYVGGVTYTARARDTCEHQQREEIEGAIGAHGHRPGYLAGE